MARGSGVGAARPSGDIQGGPFRDEAEAIATGIHVYRTRCAENIIRAKGETGPLVAAGSSRGLLEHQAEPKLRAVCEQTGVRQGAGCGDPRMDAARIGDIDLATGVGQGTVGDGVRIHDIHRAGTYGPAPSQARGGRGLAIDVAGSLRERLMDHGRQQRHRRGYDGCPHR